jgi:hypothetical protein
MTNWTHEELQQVLSKVMRRASTDAPFRALALEDAAAAIAQVHSKQDSTTESRVEIRVAESTGG